MKDQSEVFITTIDNPYDYFTHFSEWLAYDNEYGYSTQLLRFVRHMFSVDNK